MSLRSLLSSSERWLSASRHAPLGTLELDHAATEVLVVLLLAGLPVVVARFSDLLTSPDLGLPPLEIVRVVVVASAACGVYAGVVAWLDRNEKEPWKLVLSVLLLGAVAGFGLINGVARLVRSDFEILLKDIPLYESEYRVLFPDDSWQVLELQCERPDHAVDVLDRQGPFEQVLHRVSPEGEGEEDDRVVFAVSQGIRERLPSIRRELKQARVECRWREPYYASSRDYFEKGLWLDVRDRLFDDIIGPKRIGPLIEEAIKGLLVLLLAIALQREFDGPVDGIVYGALVGLGFALTENAVYVIDKDVQEQFLKRIVLRGLSGHATYTASTGLGLGIARSSQNRRVKGLAPLGGFATAVLAHTLWNTFGGQLMEEWGLVAGVLAVNGPFLGLVAIGLSLSLQKEGEVVRSFLPEDLCDAATYTARSDLETPQARRRARRRAGREIGQQKAHLVSALQRTLIEIAFCHWYAHLEELDPATMPGLSALRHRVLDLRADLAGRPD